MEGYANFISRRLYEIAQQDPETVQSVADRMITPEYLHFMETQIISMMDSSPDYINMMRQSFNTARVTRENLDDWLPAQPFVFVSFRTLLSLQSFPSRQELLNTGTSFLKPGDGNLWLAIFVSHRWESESHPDRSEEEPERNNRQLHTLQRFVRMVLSLFKFSRGFPVEDLPTNLAHHGWLQAAFVAGLDFLRSKGHDAASADEVEQLMLDHCGIWYDYACLYQKPRTAKQEINFKSSLHDLSSLVQGCSCSLTLRDYNDDYMTRGWCVWEMAAYSTFTTGMATPGGAIDGVDFPLSLHVGEIGNPLPNDFLSRDRLEDNVPMVQAEFVKHSCLLVRALRDWSMAVKKLNDTGEIMSVQHELEDVTESLFLVFMMQSESEVLIAFDTPRLEKYGQKITGNIKRFCDELHAGECETANLRDALEGALEFAGLRCTANSDQAFLGLKFLQQYKPPNNILGLSHSFLTEAIHRVLENKSLTIVAANQSIPGNVRFDDGASVFQIYPQGHSESLERISRAVGVSLDDNNLMV